MTVTPLDVAEDAFAHTSDPPPWERVELDGYVLRNTTANPHPMFGAVLRPRLGDRDLDAVLADVRRWFRERGRDRYIIGSASITFTPGGAYPLGGNVAVDARGRGVYRALVRALVDSTS